MSNWYFISICAFFIIIKELFEIVKVLLEGLRLAKQLFAI